MPTQHNFNRADAREIIQICDLKNLDNSPPARAVPCHVTVNVTRRLSA